jgi:manganese/zinc/iron transport system ATP- binding protein
MTGTDIAIEAHNLNVIYHRKPALWNVDFKLPTGHISGIMGPNGSGKSTLLKTIMGIIHADSGWVKAFGKPIDEIRKQVSYIPQRQEIDWDFPTSVYEVVAMGRYVERGLFKRLNKTDHKIIESALEKVNMSGFRKRQISQLSGGQQQRVFLARALAQEADMYLMDEPFAGVDAATEQAIIALMKEMKAKGKTVVVVHHDISTAEEYFDYLLLLNTRLVACGRVEDTFNNDTLRDTYGGQLDILSRLGNELKDTKIGRKPK